MTPLTKVPFSYKAVNNCCNPRLVSVLNMKITSWARGMSTSHIERTEAVARRPSIHDVELSSIQEVNPNVRLFHLNPHRTDDVKASRLRCPLAYFYAKWLG